MARPPSLLRLFTRRTISEVRTPGGFRYVTWMAQASDTGTKAARAPARHRRRAASRRRGLELARGAEVTFTVP